ncbi:AAA family ATPase [Weissella confusa]|uniref:AAA family ATPase n=1 Tax=Weissella confusa TaxID=1583 RepID=A0A923SP84_WEICO|nr:AAA family ATPase [Weissella confusa]
MLTELLGPVDRDLYQAVFSFDQDALTQIFALRPDEFAEHLRLLADGLQVIQGLNEAGKTTLHQFLLGMLFGFPQAKGRKVNTYEPLEQGPYGGHLQFEVNGTTYELTRLGCNAWD